MKLENWNVQQAESCLCDGIISKITLSTYDEFDTREFIEYIKAYDSCKGEQTLNTEEE